MKEQKCSLNIRCKETNERTAPEARDERRYCSSRGLIAVKILRKIANNTTTNSLHNTAEISEAIITENAEAYNYIYTFDHNIKHQISQE